MDEQYTELKYFEDYKDTFKEISKNKSEKTYLVQSTVEAIDFDAVVNKYVKGMKLARKPCSSDALYITADKKFYLIEFKDTNIDKKILYEVNRKIYESLLIFNDIIKENISFCRENVYFILVYSENSNSKASIYSTINRKAGQVSTGFALENLKKIFFKDVYTCNEREFEQFLNKNLVAKVSQ